MSQDLEELADRNLAASFAGGKSSGDNSTAVIARWIEYDRLVRLDEIVATSNSVAKTDARLGKVEQLAALLKRLAADEIEIAVAFLSGSLPQGRIGVAGSVIASGRSAPAAATRDAQSGRR